VIQILIADDEPVSRGLARAALLETGCNIALAEDGQAAWSVIAARSVPMLAILDRQMPHVDGLELCRRAQRSGPYPPLYIVMVTSAGEKSDVAEGLEAGADDYIPKPFNAAELRARANVGLRMLALQESLARRVADLEAALASVKQLRGLLPMCCYCKKIRVDNSYWQQLEAYLVANSEAQVSHGICPECLPHALDETRDPRR
jgi:sigma-B regulation protein RsbU (phosphoserine phosphatase)